MIKNKLEKIDSLINTKQIREAQLELSNLGPEFLKNWEKNVDLKLKLRDICGAKTIK